MSDLDMVDKTGAIPTKTDFECAIQAVADNIIGSTNVLPPSLMIQMPVIHRCLKFGLHVINAIEKKSASAGQSK